MKFGVCVLKVNKKRQETQRKEEKKAIKNFARKYKF